MTMQSRDGRMIERLGARSQAIGVAGRQGANMIELQRRRLLLAVTEILSEEGLEGVTVGRVCKRAGVSRRTFYDIFDDREACVLAAFEQAIEQLARSVVPVYARDGSWHDRVREALTVLLECFDRRPAIARLCVVEALRAGPAVLKRRMRVLAMLGEALQEGCTQAKSRAAIPALTTESVIGGALTVIHGRIVVGDTRPFVELAGQLVSMIVYPYLGPAAARHELERSTSRGKQGSPPRETPSDPFKNLSIRITFRTAEVLASVAQCPGASNSRIGREAKVLDQGQMSKLLRRLEASGLIENRSDGHPKGRPNAWWLTARGETIQLALGSTSAVAV